LTSKSQSFQDALRSIEEQRRITRDLLAGDQRRLRDDLESRIDALRTKASSKLVGVIDENLTAIWGTCLERRTQAFLRIRIASTRSSTPYDGRRLISSTSRSGRISSTIPSSLVKSRTGLRNESDRR
jgi:hypothetical protein